MHLSITAADLIIFIVGVAIGLVIPRGRRYAGYYYRRYRRRY